MDVGPGGPAEPEEADGNGEGADAGGRQAPLGSELAVGVELGLDDAVEVPGEGWEHEEDADEDAEEGEALEPEAEAVDAAEDDGEGLEPDVQQAVDEGDVEVECEHDGLGEEEREGPHQHHLRHVPARHLLANQLGLADKPVVSRELSQPPRPPVQDVGRRRLGQEEAEHG